MNVIFIGHKSDSGYGQATESFKKSFQEIKDFNINYYIPGDLVNYDKNIIYDVEFIIGPPPFERQRKGKYRIIYFYWETDLLPDSWASNILDSDEIWAPCNLVKDVCIKSGYKKNIKIIPTPSMASTEYKNIKLKNNFSNLFINPNYYKFYSIFQWQPRKGYDELLSSYLEEFKNGEETILILKTNLISGLSEQDIINYIKKKKTYINSKAKIFLITKYLSNIDIFSLHKYSDCFILPHYGEGWGMPIHEAAVFGNPIITTKYGGITDFIDNNVYWIDYKMESVKNMEWNNVYSSKQNWAKPSIISIKDNLRFAFNNKIKKSYGFNDFSIKQISNKIKERLHEIKA
jgi:glycosyltransferase involved in cell wall biosynthesis